MGQALRRSGSDPAGPSTVLNRLVPDSSAAPTAYRMTPALAVAMLGRGVVTLGALVVLATLLDAVAGTGPAPVVVVAVAGLALLGARAWWLLRRWVLRLSEQGYDVRGLPGVGVGSASWSEVGSAAAAGSSGTPCLLIRLVDGRTTVLPMTALAGDRELVAADVQRRLRDAHLPEQTRTEDPEGS